MKNILAICGSTRSRSANLFLLQHLRQMASPGFALEIYEDLAALPHFNPDLDMEKAPDPVAVLRDKIIRANGVIICTPEYVFSLPGSLKNALEWMVSTTIFTDKPTGLITASANGAKGHEQLELVMRTLSAAFTEETQLLIPGIKGKFDADGNLKDMALQARLQQFLTAFEKQIQ